MGRKSSSDSEELNLGRPIRKKRVLKSECSEDVDMDDGLDISKPTKENV